MNFSDRLNQLVVKHGGGSSDAFGRLCGFNGESVRQWINEKSKPSMDKLIAIAENCGVSLDWLMLGARQEQLPEEAGPFSFVRRYDVRASAGPGALVPFDDINDSEQFVAFRTEWLRRIGVSPRRAEVLIAVGDSMEPTIRDQDLLLVDREIDRIVDNGIYVLVLGGLVLVKRVQTRHDGSVILISDNPRYENEPVSAGDLPNLRVEGRVRWFGRTI